MQATVAKRVLQAHLALDETNTWDKVFDSTVTIGNGLRVPLCDKKERKFRLPPEGRAKKSSRQDWVPIEPVEVLGLWRA